MIVKQSDLRPILMNKLCGEGSFIRVPEGAEYSAEGATNVVLHAATSSSNSIEAAVQDLREMNLRTILSEAKDVLKQRTR